MTMVDIRFWNSANECLKVNGLYIHTVPMAVVENCIEAVAKSALEKGANCITVDDIHGQYRVFDLYEKDNEVYCDEYETIEDDYESNMYCDNTGLCNGYHCPYYNECKGNIG